MSVIIRRIAFGSVFGTVIGVAILIVNNLREPFSLSTVTDAHGYIFFVVLLLGAVAGALFGVAASLGDYLKKKFEDESE
jgi:uncharacterized membrane protein